MPRKRYSYLQAVVDFIVFNLVTWGLVFLQPTIAHIYGRGVLANILPLLISVSLVILLADNC